MKKPLKRTEIASLPELVILLLLLFADACIVQLCVEAVWRKSLPLAVDWFSGIPGIPC